MTGEIERFPLNRDVFPLPLLFDALDEEYEGRPLFSLTAHFAIYLRVGGTLLVPPGFVTDFCSIPWIARLFALPDHVPARPASVGHDFLCVVKALPRLDTDQVFRDALRDNGVGRCRTGIYYSAVRVVNGSNWHRNDARARRRMNEARELCRLHRGGVYRDRLDFAREPFALLEAA